MSKVHEVLLVIIKVLKTQVIKIHTKSSITVGSTAFTSTYRQVKSTTQKNRSTGRGYKTRLVYGNNTLVYTIIIIITSFGSRAAARLYTNNDTGDCKNKTKSNYNA